MSGEVTTKVRIVICPKCQQLLPELPNFDVYMCGGCGKTLKAKKRVGKDDSVKSENIIQKTETVKENELNLGFGPNEELSSSPESSTSLSSEVWSSDKNTLRDHKESAFCNGDAKLSNEVKDNETDNSHLPDCGKDFSDEMPKDDEVEASSELMAISSQTEGNKESSLSGAHHLNGGKELINGEVINSPAEREKEINHENLPSVGENSELENVERDSTLKGLSVKGRMSHVPSQRSVAGSIQSGSLITTSNDQPEKSERTGNSTAAAASFVTAENFHYSSELSGTLQEMSKSPTRRSSHAYDGSVSSLEGIDDRFPNRPSKNSFDPYNVVRFAVSEGTPMNQKNRHPGNRMVHRDLKTQYHPRNFSADLARKMHYSTKHSKWDQDGIPEPTRHGHQAWKWVRTEGEECMSRARMPFYQMEQETGYGSGCSSRGGYDEFHHNSNLEAPDIYEDPEQEKNKLLRMVYELQDQLERSTCLRGTENGRISGEVPWQEKLASPYNYQEANEGRFFYDVKSSGGCRCQNGWKQKHKFSHIPFSGEATSSRQRVDYPCSHCRHRDRPYSAHLPPVSIPKNKGMHRFHPAQDYLISPSSCPSSPQRYMSSEFPISRHETNSDFQRRRAHELKYAREKPSLIKRHFRPVAGGAPLVTCYYCSQLLQLPADFLLFKRRHHRLRCGACFKVLQFSLLNGSHIVSYAQEASAAPANGVANSDPPRHYTLAESVSCSDDCRPLAYKSGSSEGDTVFLTPHQPVHADPYSRSISSDTFKAQKKFSSKKSRYASDTPLQAYELARGASSSMSGSGKPAAENEDPPAPRNSPLHRLMGYHSPSAVMKGSSSSGQK